MSQLQARNLWKEYDDKVVLERINVAVNHGEFVTIVGASGCGKTTFLRMLLGTEQVSRGKLLLDGLPIPNEPGADRGIVFQKYSVFPHLTALQNLLLAAELTESRLLGRLFGAARKRALEQARSMLDTVGLGQDGDKFPHQLSGGMQQRLAIAQALTKQPKILLLDEPFGALDPGIRADMHRLILDIWKKTGINIFMITHDLKEGFYLGTRLWVFDKIRHDPQEPQAYGATITFDIATNKTDRATLKEITRDLNREPKERVA